MTEHVRVVVVDDHSLFRTGVVQSLGLDKSIEIVGEGSSGADAVNLAATCSPDLILLDISMPGNGIHAAGEILKRSDPPKVVMLTVSEDEDDIMSALEAGAVGYVLKGIEARDLITAVKDVASGASFVSPNLALRLVSTMKVKAKAEAEISPLTALTKQEERTLRLVTLGLSNREIAADLGVLERTVKFYMTRIMKKLKVRNRVEAALIARDLWGERPPADPSRQQSPQSFRSANSEAPIKACR